MLLELGAQLQALTKLLDEPHAAEVRQVAFLERKNNLPSAFWHPHTNYPSRGICVKIEKSRRKSDFTRFFACWVDVQTHF